MFTICTNQSHLPKKPKVALKNMNFLLDPDREIRTTFSRVLLLPEIFHWDDPKRRVPVFSNRIFRKRFVITAKQQLPPWSSVETNSRLFYSCIAPLYDCLKNIALFSQPIRSKFKAARGLVPATCVLFRCDWLMCLSAFIAIDRFTLVRLVS